MLFHDIAERKVRQTFQSLADRPHSNVRPRIQPLIQVDGQWQLSTHCGHRRATSNLPQCPSSKDRPSAADRISKSHAEVIAARTSRHAATRANGNFVPRHSVKGPSVVLGGYAHSPIDYH